ncbi:hypothetical protein OAO01_00945 [Oligoflexia bacterium]|nr:hypothetical protein [Oligoflexia bacterium]
MRETRALIERAATILSELGEAEHRVAWLLEDCADLLNEKPEEWCREPNLFNNTTDL